MKKADQYQQNRELINEALDAAKDAKMHRSLPHHYRLEKLNELKNIKDTRYEREQATKEEAHRAKEEEIAELRAKLEEAQRINRQEARLE
jgi:biopolymer transport protein ExbB/TolQ